MQKIKLLLRPCVSDVWITLLFFILPAILFFPALTGQKTLIPADNLYQYEPWASYRAEQGVPDVPHNALLSDLVLQNYQWKSFLRESINNREIPLWQPNQFSGTPFLANGQHSGLYPFSVIYYVLPLDMAYGWFTVSQLWLAGLLMYIFIRGIGLSRFSGVIAGTGYQLSHFFIVSTVHPMMQAGAAWLPLLLLMLEFVIQQKPLHPALKGRFLPGLPWVLIGGCALGMNFLAGHIEITYYTLLVMAFYAAVRLLVEIFYLKKALKSQLLAVGMMILLVAIGFGLGAVQFIPMVETANHSFRTERSSLDEVMGYALPKRHIAKWLMPNAYGNPAQHGYWDVTQGKWIDQDWHYTDEAGNEIQVTNTDFGIKNYVEGGVYVGILILILAGMGLIFTQPASEIPYRGIFALMGLIAAALMFGTPLYALLYYGFPGIEQLHTPFRWAWPFTLVLSVLAAHGAENLLNQGLKPLVNKIGIGFIFIGLLTVISIFVMPDSVIERVYDSLAGANRAFPDSQAFYGFQTQNMLIFALMLAGSGGVLLLSGKSWTLKKVPLWQIAAVGLIAIDLIGTGYGFNTFAERDWLNFTPPSMTWLQQKYQEEAQPFRIQAFDWGERPLIANVGWQYGLQDVRGYDSLFSKQYADYMQQIAPQGGLAFNRINPIAYNNPQALLSPELAYLNVKYIITDWIIRPEEEFGVQELSEVGLELAYEGKGVRIYENLNALPRAYAIENLDDLSPQNPESLIPATITRYESISVFVDVEIPENADNTWLILADTYSKGWRAFVRPVGTDEDKEQQIDVHQVLGNFRGVQLEPGAWTVRFKYSPQSFQVGAFTSFVTGMVVIFLLLLWLWNNFVSEAAHEDSSRRVIKNSLAPIFMNLFNRGIDFAFAFIMLRILGPKDAGIYYYAIVVFGWFDIMTNFGLNTLLTREVSRDKSQARRYLFNTTALRLALSLLGIPLLILFLMLRDATVEPALDRTALLAIGLLYLGLIPNSISTGLSALFYAFERAEYPAALATITTLIKVSLGLGALLMGYGVVELAGVSIITNLATFFMMGRLALPFILSADQSAGHLSKPLVSWMVGESWPLMINHFLATIFFKSDVILMEAINGAAIVGIYSTAYKWMDALNIIPAFFTMALLPMMSRQAQEDKTALRRNYIFGFKSLVMVALPVAVVTTFIAPFLIGFLGGREYLPDGGIALQIMIWSIPIGWINSLTQYVLIALDRQRQITFAFIAAVSFNIGGNLLFMPQYSYRAAAVTTIISEMVLLVGFYFLLRPDLGDINFAKVLWKPVTATGIMLAGMVIMWQIAPLLAVLAAGLVYPAGLLMLNPLMPEESERLKRIFRRNQD